MPSAFVRLSLCGIIPAVMLLIGCGGGLDLGKPVDVTGTVRLDGEPVPDARVTFFNQDGGAPSQYRSFTGETGADGRYSISGVYPATYAVSIFPKDAPDAGEGDVPATETGPLSQYGSASTLTATVSESQTDHDFDLTSSPSR